MHGGLEGGGDLRRGGALGHHGLHHEHLADHARHLAEDHQRINTAEAVIVENGQRLVCLPGDQGVGKGEGVVFVGRRADAEHALPIGNVLAVRQKVKAQLVDLACQNEHAMAAVFDHVGAKGGRGLDAVVQKMLLHPGGQLHSGDAVEPDGGKPMVDQPLEQGRGLFGQISRIKGGGETEDQGVVIKFGEHFERLKQGVDLLGMKSLKVEARHQHELSLAHHGQRGQRVKQALGGEVEAVDAQNVEDRERAVGTKGLLGRAKGKALEVVLLADKDVACTGCSLDLLAEIPFLEQEHGREPPFRKKCA